MLAASASAMMKTKATAIRASRYITALLLRANVVVSQRLIFNSWMDCQIAGKIGLLFYDHLLLLTGLMRWEREGGRVPSGCLPRNPSFGGCRPRMWPTASKNGDLGGT